jgi:hypothetical protein
VAVDQINTKTAVTRSENGNDGHRNGGAGWVEAGAEQRILLFKNRIEAKEREMGSQNVGRETEE